MYNTHLNTDAVNDALGRALIDLMGMMNSPRQDDLLIAEAGVTLDRALFPLLVKIGMAGTINVVDLADLAGRDHSTVSRQIARLEALGLIARRPGQADRRVRDAILTDEGKATVQALTAARRRLMNRFMADWPDQDRVETARLVAKLAATLKTAVDGGA